MAIGTVSVRGQPCPVRLKLSDIDDRVQERPDGYKARVLSAGMIDGDEIEIPDEEYQKLCDEFRNDGPTLAEMAANFAKATARWLKAGCPVVSREVFERRLGPTGCATCLYFDPSARGNRGKCNHPKCGCTSEWKAWLATEICPDNKVTINRPGWVP
jgi:hypothetical protein